MFAEPLFQQLVSIENEEGRHFDSSGPGPDANLRARNTKDGGDRRIQESPSPVGLGAPTPAPTLGVICYVCGDDTMKVTAGLSTTLQDGTVYECTLVEQTGLLQYFGEFTCGFVQNLAASDCGCVPIQGSIAPAPSPIAASIPSSGFDAPTPAPTLGVLCHVCGDENMEVTAGLTTTLLDGSMYDCIAVERAGLLELYSETACDYAQLEAVSDCGCVPKEGSTTSAPSAAIEDSLGSPSPAPTGRSQPMESPVASPDGNGSPREIDGEPDSASSSSGGGGLAYLAALLVIPVGAVIVFFLVRRKKNDGGPNNSKPSGNFAAPVDNVDETSSNPPAASGSSQYYAHTPNIHHHETMPSVTASSFTSEGYSGGRVLHSSGGDGSASGTTQSHSADHLHPSIGETSAGSSSNRTPMPYASAAPSPVPNTVGYTPTNKDQCRTVVGGEEILAVAVAVDEDISVQSEAVSERRRPRVDP